jgi:cytochrome c biogenesis protein CcmG/thiol:disulfide interchange protein DsbE
VSEGSQDARKGRGPRLTFLLPLGIFLSLAMVFFVQLLSGDDPATIPSVLVGKPVPEFSLPPLEGLLREDMSVPGLSTADFADGVSVVNIFASWCGPCRQEHPILEALAEDRRIRVFGINYKDVPENARRFLGELGNPYAAVGVDERGRAAIDWGVYGVPETFLVGPDGIIRHKFIGPLSEEAVKETLMPEIEKLLASGGGTGS